MSSVPPPVEEEDPQAQAEADRQADEDAARREEQAERDRQEWEEGVERSEADDEEQASRDAAEQGGLPWDDEDEDDEGAAADPAEELGEEAGSEEGGEGGDGTGEKDVNASSSPNAPGSHPRVEVAREEPAPDEPVSDEQAVEYLARVRRGIEKLIGLCDDDAFHELESLGMDEELSPGRCARRHLEDVYLREVDANLENPEGAAALVEGKAPYKRPSYDDPLRCCDAIYHRMRAAVEKHLRYRVREIVELRADQLMALGEVWLELDDEVKRIRNDLRTLQAYIKVGGFVDDSVTWVKTFHKRGLDDVQDLGMNLVGKGGDKADAALTTLAEGMFPNTAAAKSAFGRCLESGRSATQCVDYTDNPKTLLKRIFDAREKLRAAMISVSRIRDFQDRGLSIWSYKVVDNGWVL